MWIAFFCLVGFFFFCLIRPIVLFKKFAKIEHELLHVAFDQSARCLGEMMEGRQILGVVAPERVHDAPTGAPYRDGIANENEILRGENDRLRRYNIELNNEVHRLLQGLRKTVVMPGAIEITFTSGPGPRR